MVTQAKGGCQGFGAPSAYFVALAAGEFADVIRERFSVLEYAHRDVSPELVRAILDAAMAAHTACNFQPQRILVIDDDESREKLHRVVPSRYSALPKKGHYSSKELNEILIL